MKPTSNNNSDSGVFKSFADYSKNYLSKGLSVIPLMPNDKKPVKEWKKYQETLPTEKELEEWFTNTNYNIGIVCGSVSQNLVVIDFDSEDKFKDFLEKARGLKESLKFAIANTWLVKTGKGVHVYFKIEADDPEEIRKIFRTKARLVEDVDIRAEGGYVVAPPSLHPETKTRYMFVKKIRIDEKGRLQYELIQDLPENQIQTLRVEEFAEILKLLGVKQEEILKLLGYRPKSHTPGEVKANKNLSEEQIKKIVGLIEPYYVEGHRNMIIYSLLGVLMKAGISYESARRVVELITTQTNDEEAKERLYLVDYHYGKRGDGIGVDRLKGVSGLREEFEKVLREMRVSENEIVKRASETIAELYSTLDLERGPGVAWLERKGGFIIKWVAVGRQGISLFKRREIATRKGGPDEPTAEIVSDAVIRSSKVVRIRGLDLENIYLVDINGKEISGTVSEIIEYIQTKYGITRGAEFAVARLIKYMAEEEEELFYSPGPWVVDGKIVFAKEAGYTPSWKQSLIWNIPEDDVEEDVKREALEAIRNLVLAYRDPTKPSTVLCYAAIAPIMHHVKKILNIAPHMIIHGLENTGKTILLDTVKLLYNTWEETLPASDYQARRVLATSTLPAVIDEIGGIIQGYVKEERNSVDAIEVIHRAATQEMLRVSGGHNYGGYYLAIRTIIGATNTDISLVPWQLDKIIPVTISTKEAIDVKKAQGYTPRTMKEEVRRALPNIGIELLKEVEKLLPKIEELRRLSRAEIREKLIELGYEVWVNLYNKYGLEPFPIPSKPETEIEKTSMKEQIEDIFISYLENCIKAEKGYPTLVKYREKKISEEKEISEDALETLNKNLAIIIIKEDGSNELVCKTAFLTRFIEWATREFRIPRIGWQRLAEMLDMKMTSRRIGGKIDKNLLKKQIF